jgi:hypothetical protein
MTVNEAIVRLQKARDKGFGNSQIVLFPEQDGYDSTIYKFEETQVQDCTTNHLAMTVVLMELTPVDIAEKATNEFHYILETEDSHYYEIVLDTELDNAYEYLGDANNGFNGHILETALVYKRCVFEAEFSNLTIPVPPLTEIKYINYFEAGFTKESFKKYAAQYRYYDSGYATGTIVYTDDEKFGFADL